ncbi:MAG: GIY-YIG nuclease family protein [Planctomycetes bacterium]|nr:GIY-YIG nuclease family protein [Planctomycetota bacterium]
MSVEKRRVRAPSVWKLNRLAFMPCQAFFYNRAIPKTIYGLRDFDRVTRVDHRFDRRSCCPSTRHNQPDPKGTRYSSKHGPWKLVWSESHPDRANAMRREKQIKGKKSWVE